MKKDSVEDAAFILYIFPILINGAYGLWSWIAGGADLDVLQKVYLNITREPIIFLAGLLAVCVAVLLDTKYLGSLEDIDRRVTRLAYFCFITALIIAIVSTGFNIASSLTLFLQGRYALIFPALLVLLSLLMRLRGLSLGFSNGVFRGISLILLLISPLTLYILWRLGAAWYIIFAVPFILIIASIGLMKR
ncbi:MAG: hypothetical protein QXW32_00510 [Nitrososphaerales archaeon]